MPLEKLKLILTSRGASTLVLKLSMLNVSVPEISSCCTCLNLLSWNFYCMVFLFQEQKKQDNKVGDIEG